MRVLVLFVLMLFAPPHVLASDVPVPAVAAAPKVDFKKLRADVAKLSEGQKRELLADIRRQLPKATVEEKEAKEEASRKRWQTMAAEDRAEYRAKYAASWTKLTPEEKTIQREKIAERLKALPESDRASIVQSLTTKTKELTHE